MKYTQEYRIYENDVDFRKMATLGTLLRYCQQIGTEDAEHYGITPELYASTHTSYVLAKLALHITRTPRVEETITVQTEPEALRRAVEKITVMEKKSGQRLNSLSASFGVAEYLTGDGYEQIMRRADDQLYRAKELGRNRVMPMSL